MRRRHRGVLTVLAVLVIGAIAAGFAWSAWIWRLPDPAEADREQLLHWLVLRELNEQPRETQSTLVDRLVAELKADAGMTGQAAELSPAYQQRLLRNLEVLKEVWFCERVADYHALAGPDRMSFLEQQIGTIMIWANVDIGTSDAGFDAQAQRHAFTTQFFGDVERWMTAAEPVEAARMAQAVQAGLTCWLATRSLADEPMATRRDLAGRIIAELDRGLRLDAVLAELTVDQRQMLQDNGWLLLEAWLYNESDVFATLPSGEQLGYVDRQIQRFLGWGFVELFSAAPQATSAAASSQTLVQLLANVEQWIEQAEPERQAKLRPLVDLVQQQMMLRSLQSMFGG